MGIYGIDFGTTYSCLAVADENGRVEVIPNMVDGSDTLASVVWFESEDNVVVGASAKDMVVNEGDEVVECIKRELGKSDAKEREFYGKTYSAVDISTMIFLRIKYMAEDLDYAVKNVILAYPPYYDRDKRNRIRLACEASGLKVIDTIPESAAAAMAFTNGCPVEDSTMLVCDQGDDSLDISLVRMSIEENDDGKPVQKIATLTLCSDDRLKGRDWDELLFNHILNTCASENGLEPTDIDEESRQNIRSKVEATKKRLTNADSARVRALIINGIPTAVTVTREEFENMSAHLVDNMMCRIESTLDEFLLVSPDQVLLVGGSTLMPMIRNAVEARFPGRVWSDDPHTAVARGAAIYGSIIAPQIAGNG